MKPSSAMNESARAALANASASSKLPSTTMYTKVASYITTYTSTRADRAIVRIYVSKQYKKIVAHEGSSPRVIDQVIRQGVISGDQSEVASKILRALERPIDLWGPSLQHSLTETSQDILFHLTSFPVEGAAPSELRDVALRQHSPLAYSTALRQIEGSWIRIASSSRSGSNLRVAFHDPSCRDFMLSLFDAEPDYFVRTILRSRDASQVCNLLNYVRSSRWA